MYIYIPGVPIGYNCIHLNQLRVNESISYKNPSKHQLYLKLFDSRIQIPKLDIPFPFTWIAGNLEVRLSMFIERPLIPQQSVHL